MICEVVGGEGGRARQGTRGDLGQGPREDAEQMMQQGKKAPPI